MLLRNLLASVVVFALLPVDSFAQSYRCVGKDGKKYYGSSIPAECAGLAIEEMNAQGSVVRRIAPRETAEDRARREAAAKQEAEGAAAHRGRVSRNRALVATYKNESDIEDARGRALSNNQTSMKIAEERIAHLRGENDEFKKRLTSYKGNSKPPSALVESASNVAIDLKAQEDLLAARKQEAATINAKYADDLKRFRELRDMDASARAKALGMDRGVNVITKEPTRQEIERNRAEARAVADRDRRELRQIELEQERARRYGQR